MENSEKDTILDIVTDKCERDMKKKKLKIYLETSLFNFYIDESKGEAHKCTVLLFEEIGAGKYEAFTSNYVISELEKADEEREKKMMGLFNRYDITILPENDRALGLAEIYVAEGVIPKKYEMDGTHIAVAAVNGLDIIISMNFRHIVKRKTIIMTNAINKVNGYRAVEIYSPMEVVENE
jgi:hypothetical protein